MISAYIKRPLATSLMIFMLFSTAQTVFAEDEKPQADLRSGPVEPTETEIILPEMYLEIEDLTIEEINAVIPDEDEVMLSSIELQLPQPDEIEIPTAAFAVDGSAAPASYYGTGRSPESSFFSESTIGVGTSANITGDINLYHIGEQPGFRLRYFHDSYDGFAGSEAGKGYSAREELIEAELNYSTDQLSGDMFITYNEYENGLQGKAGEYTALTRRIPGLNTDIAWTPAEKISLTGILDARALGMQLNAVDDPLGFYSWSLAPEAEFLYGTEALQAGVKINYGLESFLNGGGISQSLGGGLLFSAEPAPVFRISAEADVFWDNWQKVYFPFSVALSGTSSTFDYSLSGGFRAFFRDRAELWDVYPAAGGPEAAASMGSIPLTSGWFGEGGIRWNITDSLIVRYSADFSVYENALKPTPSALSGFYSVSAGSTVCLGTSAKVYWKVSDVLSVNAGWSGQLLEQMDWYKPRHLVDTSVELTSRDRNMGITGDVELRIYDPEQIWYSTYWVPYIGLEGYLRISDGFIFSLSGKDLAAGALSEGRAVWGEYLDMGTRLQAKIKISL